MSATGKASTHLKSRKPSPDTRAAVDAFMAALVHPCKDQIEALRGLFLGVDPRIAEGIKWNAPSFRSGEYFATTNLRAKAGVGVILHFGAKARALPAGGIVIDDPDGLLKWLAPGRAMLEFANGDDIAGKHAALAAIIRQWVAIV